ncbi:phosphatase [Campylobacterota bacterium]|nr:phosphatase [Campylobacterota bacterium]
MAKITAVIDIGSNSVRMAVFERTSRLGFHLLREVKSRARISENAYKNGGVLQEAAMRRSEQALSEFAHIAKGYDARKVLVVATSAVRDAPNKADFLRRVRAVSGLQIRVIDGKEEARLGGVAAANLLGVRNGVTIDIGGGSTELALISEGKIASCVSFDLGTVRLKELFFDGEMNIDGAKRFIQSRLEALGEEFANSLIIGIGGTLRALATVIMRESGYQFDALHGFRFAIGSLEKIVRSSDAELSKMGFKNDRLDVIREGVLIFASVAAKIGAKQAITSGVGVREGAFLTDLLRNENDSLPKGAQPSVICLLDRFAMKPKQIHWNAHCAAQFFDAMREPLGLDERHRMALITAAKLLTIGERVDPYHQQSTGATLVLNALAYGFNHTERLLIAELVASSEKRRLQQPPNENYAALLPSAKEIRALGTILYLTKTLGASKTCPKLTLTLVGNELTISGAGYLARETLVGFKSPIDIKFFAK